MPSSWLKTARPTKAVAMSVAGGLLALAAVVLVSRSVYPVLIARHWKARLDRTPEAELDITTQTIGQLGDPGIRVLVEAIDSKRKAQALAARRELFARIDRWKALSSSERSGKMGALAERLRQNVPRFSPAAKHHAADLATRILYLGTLDTASVEPLDLIASCEEVLRVRPTEPIRETKSPRPRGTPSREPRRRRLPEVAVPSQRRPLPSDLGPDRKTPLAGLAVISGGGLPMEMFEVDELPAEGAARLEISVPDPRIEPLPPAPPPRSSQPIRISVGDPAEPELLEPSRPSLPLAHKTPPLAHKTPPLAHKALPLAHKAPPLAHKAPPLAHKTPPLPSADAGPGREEPAALANRADLGEAHTTELIQRLRSRDAAYVARLREELARRGFGPVEMDLATRVCHPDPAVRIAMVRQLPNLVRIDPVPWLLLLARDSHPEVRLSAVTLMATTGNPDLIEAIEDLARHDPDPRVQFQARRVR